MRNVFLSLVLAVLLVLAWEFWVEPPAPGSNSAGSQPGANLELYSSTGRAGTGARPAAASPPAGPPTGPPSDPPAQPNVPGPAAGAGDCVRVGPLPSESAAQQAGLELVSQGIDAIPIARDAQLWLGHWVQIPGFDSVTGAEAARQRLVAEGIPDAYLMQDGAQPMISLGVFRDRAGADRVAAAAQGLGFRTSVRDRYRPTVEQWLLLRLRPGQVLQPEALGRAGDRIMRTEPAPCDSDGANAAPAGPAGADAPLPTRLD